MNKQIGKSSKFLMAVAASAMLVSCGSIGGFSELLGISNEGIDAQNVAVNSPLKNANGGSLPTPEGAALTNASATTPSIQAPRIIAPAIIAPKIVAPKIVAPKITKPKVQVAKISTPKVTVPKVITPVVVTPKVTTPKVTTPTTTITPPKVDVKPVVAAVTPSKIAPTAYKFIDLFTFRSDMRAGKLSNALATAQYIARTNPTKCKIEAKKFTCGEYFITVQ